MFVEQQEEGSLERFAVCGFFIRPRGQRARRSQEKLAQGCGEISEGILACYYYGGRLVSNSLAVLPREIGRGGDNAQPTSPRLVHPRPPAACSATTLHPLWRGGTSTCSGNGDLCHGQDGTLHLACYKQHHACGADVVVGKSAVGGKTVLVMATRDEL
jgi:hypothetical protein